MNTYKFYYVTDYELEVTYTTKARSLSQAFKIFYRESESFSDSVRILLPRYEVINSEGKWSSRLIPSKYSLIIIQRGKENGK